MDKKLLLGKRIAELRKAAGYSQEEFAFRINICRQHMSTIESGQSNVTFETLCKICKGLNITLKELFDFDI